MKAFGRWSVISVFRFIVQFAWSLMLIPIVVLTGLFIYSLISGGSILWIGISAYIDSSASSINDVLGTNAVIFGSISGAETFYVSSRPLSPISIALGLIQICIPVYIFYALSILKRPLNAMALNKIYTLENGIDLRRVAFLLIAAAPLKYGIDWLSKINLEAILQSPNAAILAPPFEFALLFAGLICFLFAEILNQATSMHHEQKLTV